MCKCIYASFNVDISCVVTNGAHAHLGIWSLVNDSMCCWLWFKNDISRTQIAIIRNWKLSNSEYKTIRRCGVAIQLVNIYSFVDWGNLMNQAHRQDTESCCASNRVQYGQLAMGAHRLKTRIAEHENDKIEILILSIWELLARQLKRNVSTPFVCVCVLVSEQPKKRNEDNCSL